MARLPISLLTVSRAILCPWTLCTVAERLALAMVIQGIRLTAVRAFVHVALRLQLLLQLPIAVVTT